MTQQAVNARTRTHAHATHEHASCFDMTLKHTACAGLDQCRESCLSYAQTACRDPGTEVVLHAAQQLTGTTLFLSTLSLVCVSHPCCRCEASAILDSARGFRQPVPLLNPQRPLSCSRGQGCGHPGASEQHVQAPAAPDLAPS